MVDGGFRFDREGTCRARARVGVYPGTFDPMHNGHMDIIRARPRCWSTADRRVARSMPARTRSSRWRSGSAWSRRRWRPLERRGNGTRIEVQAVRDPADAFRGRERAPTSSSAACARSPTSSTSSRWRPTTSGLNPKIETVFLMASETNQFISSRFVKEIHELERRRLQLCQAAGTAEARPKRPRALAAT